jgi:hypothetical protein
LYIGKFATLSSNAYVDCVEDKEINYNEISRRLHQIMNPNATISSANNRFSQNTIHQEPQNSPPTRITSHYNWGEFLLPNENVVFWAPVSWNRLFWRKKYALMLTSTCRLILVDSRTKMSKYNLDGFKCHAGAFTSVDAHSIQLVFDKGIVKILEDDLNGSDFWVNHIRSLGGFMQPAGQKRK